ncbi:Isovaleryl-CoA dehydrogenase [metagenome]|uniref:Isovaleryl-CoA dehydrogenase n=1 Tax=metagenome TaxID=256318 RepID=A0A2P2C8L6_9ZZZZ
MADPFVFDADQVDLRNTLKLFLAEHCDQGVVRRSMDSEIGYDAGLWARLGGELGVLGLTVPDELGGAGAGLVEQAILAEAMGSMLMPGPTFGTVALAIPALEAAGGPLAQELLPDLVAGRTTAAYVAPRFGADRAVTELDGRLDGEVRFVVDGAGADVLVVAAVGPDGTGLYLVDGDDALRTPQDTMDLTRRQAVVRFEHTRARPLAHPDLAASVMGSTTASAAVFLAAEQVGIAQHLLDVSVEYAKTRVQFGRPIGSFQAVKHRLADMLVTVEHARSAAYYAAWAAQEGADDAELARSLALAVCIDAATLVAGDCIQVLGGIGFTWEHEAHLYLKRAFGDAALLGSAAAHRDRVAELVLDEAASQGNLPVAGVR